MYLFVFLWVPSLQESVTETEITSEALPLGYIFSSFMVSMMLGSLLYSTIASRTLSSSPKPSVDSSLTLHAKLSSLVCAVSSAALATSVRSNNEHVRFWAFCAFEACVGMYYPVQGMLRGSLIANEHRATVSPSRHFFAFSRPMMFLFLLAFFLVPRPTEYLRGRLTFNRRVISTLCGSYSQLCHACILVRHDWSLYSQSRRSSRSRSQWP
jgi:Sugar-tranasporters, 12 TM